MRRLPALPALLLLAVPAAASAQTPPTPPAPPAAASLRLAIQRVGSDGVVLAKASWGVVGKLQPATEGEAVSIRLYRNGKRVKARTVRTAADGQFKVRLRIARSGRYEIRSTHRRSAALTTATSRPLAVEVLPRRVGPGSGADAIRALQRRLDALGYVVGELGRFDARTARAVLAFRKVSGIARTTSADSVVMRRLANGGGVWKVRYPNHGKHVEADLSRQVLALIGKDGVVQRIYVTSSGAPATPTVRGSFRFYLAQPGYNSKEMYYSKYFIRGYAIHGYKSVPVFNASHGCLRVPIPDAKSIYDWIEMGDRIDVYA